MSDTFGSFALTASFLTGYLCIVWQCVRYVQKKRRGHIVVSQHGFYPPPDAQKTENEEIPMLPMLPVRAIAVQIPPYHSPSLAEDPSSV